MDNVFGLFYIKENTAYPVAMSKNEFDQLQFIIPDIFGDKEIKVIDKPMGTIENMVKKEKKQ